MQRTAWMFSLRKGKEQAYADAHEHVWPELIEEARSAGLRNQTVYVHGSTVFVYTEAEDMNAVMNRLDSLDVTRRWNDAMSEFMEDVNGTLLTEVFHFD